MRGKEVAHSIDALINTMQLESSANIQHRVELNVSEGQLQTMNAEMVLFLGRSLLFIRNALNRPSDIEEYKVDDLEVIALPCA